MKIFLLATLACLVCLTSGKRHQNSIRDRVPRSDGPVKVAEKIFIYFTPNHDEMVYMKLKHLPRLVNHPQFNVSLPTVLYIHGWWQDGKYEDSTLAVRGAYMKKGGFNVLTMDWKHYSFGLYFTVVLPQLKVIGETVAKVLQEFFKNGYDVEKFHLVGFSLGGQMVGAINRNLKKASSGKLIIPRIYSLDPAGPGFVKRGLIGYQSITKNDGPYVQVIHSNGGELGMREDVGTVDFFPDGGSKHPGCPENEDHSIIKALKYCCNHFRAWHFFQASVLDSYAYPAVKCDDWDDFVRNGTCDRSDIAHMGFGSNDEAYGKYYLQTNGNLFNTSRGLEGTYYKTMKYIVFPPEYSLADQEVPDYIRDQVIF